MALWIRCLSAINRNNKERKNHRMLSLVEANAAARAGGGTVRGKAWEEALDNIPSRGKNFCLWLLLILFFNAIGWWLASR